MKTTIIPTPETIMPTETPPTPAEQALTLDSDLKLLAALVGHNVLLDCNPGVFWGRVEFAHASGVVLEPGARQAHFWHTLAAAVDGELARLANVGPEAQVGTRASAPSEDVLIRHDVVSIRRTTPEADARWEALPVVRADNQPRVAPLQSARGRKEA